MSNFGAGNGRVSRQLAEHGVAIEWTDAGPRIAGRGVVITPTESSALLDRWRESIDRFLEQERERRGSNDPNVGGAANVLAVIHACRETYNRVPNEEEMQEQRTELSRKFNLFYLFIQMMQDEASGERDDDGLSPP